MKSWWTIHRCPSDGWQMCIVGLDNGLQSHVVSSHSSMQRSNSQKGYDGNAQLCLSPAGRSLGSLVGCSIDWSDQIKNVDYHNDMTETVELYFSRKAIGWNVMCEGIVRLLIAVVYVAIWDIQHLNLIGRGKQPWQAPLENIVDSSAVWPNVFICRASNSDSLVKNVYVMSYRRQQCRHTGWQTQRKATHRHRTSE